MPQISRTALVPFSAEQMYQLVNDVKSYPDFLPGCTGSRVLELGPTQMTAAVDVSKAGISKTFTTRNTLTSNQSILMSLVDGPFKKLIGGWKFIPLSPEACKIEFHLDFEFTNKLIEMAFGRIFKELAANMVQAFTSRAKEVYAQRHRPGRAESRFSAQANRDSFYHYAHS